MEFSLFDLINRLNPMALTISAIGGILLLYLPLYKSSHIIMFMLSLSAALAGSILPTFDTISTLLRWVSIALLLMWGILHSRVVVSGGIILFWGYVFLGFIFMFQALSIEWQIQKGLLLLLVSIAIPFAYSSEPYKSLRLSLISVSIAGTLFSIINFLPLPGHLNQPVRFAGYCKNAGLLVEFLGSFLPFILWGLMRGDHIAIRIACASGFFLGIVTLIFSGQRTGTIGGLISIIPLLFIYFKEKKFAFSILLLLLPLLLGYTLFQHSSFGKLNFLSERYSIESGLSGREAIWKTSFSEIEKNPLIGRGIGAAENIIDISFHNAYLEVWFNTGLVGMVFFLSSQVYFFVRIASLKKLLNDSEFISVLALALGYMMGFIFMCIFESIGAGASNLNIILYLFLGVLISNKHLAENGNFSYIRAQVSD